MKVTTAALVALLTSGANVTQVASSSTNKMKLYLAAITLASVSIRSSALTQIVPSWLSW